MTTSTEAIAWLADNCDGAGPHSGPGEIRVYPIGGGGNLLLCLHCWAGENKYNFNRGRETQSPENFLQHDWTTARIYALQQDGDV